MKDNQNDSYETRFKVVDINNHVIDVVPISDKRLEKFIHQASFLFVIESQTQRIFCHQRSAHKRYFPGAMSTCFTGIVLESEDYRASAKRKLTQETGLDLQINYLSSFYYESKMNKVWGWIFFTYFDGQIINFRQNPKDVEQLELMSYREIVIRDKNGELFTPESLQALHILNKRVLRQ